MPTVFRSGPYRLFFYSADGDEPPHIHVSRDELSAKLWLDPVALAANYGFAGSELQRIGKLVKQHEALLLDSWNDFFSR